MPGLGCHHKSIAAFNAKVQSKTGDEIDGDELDIPIRPKSRTYKPDSSPKPQASRSSISKLKVNVECMNIT